MSLQEPSPSPNPSGPECDSGTAQVRGDLGAFDLSPQGRALIAQAIRGERESQRRLWHEHRRWVAAIVLAHMPKAAWGGAPELDDLLQEVAMAMVAKISGLRDETAFKPWLRAVAMSIAQTSGRRSKVRKEGWLRLVNMRGDDDRPEFDAAPGSLRGEQIADGRRLMRLAAELPDGYREPLLLKCVQGMSYKEIGRVMGLPDTTIETRIARARKMLRERAETTADGLVQPGNGSDDTQATPAAKRMRVESR